MQVGAIVKIKALLLILISAQLVSANSFGNTGRMPELKKHQYPIDFVDDLDFKNMLKAIDRQEKYFERAKLDEKVTFGKREITRGHLQKSLLSFKSYIVDTLSCYKNKLREVCNRHLSNKINTKFEFYKPVPLEWERGYRDDKTFFTAYFSPDFEGSLTQSSLYKNPIYALPPSEKLRRLTSDEITFENKLKGHEIVYVKESLFDIWLLHVEGGGRVKVKLGGGGYKYFYLSFSGTNKRKFQMLYVYMLSTGMLKKGEASISNQRKYFESHPERRREILNTCPSFIFFKLTKKEPYGVHNMELTEHRSLATDYRRIKEYGIINYIKMKKPVLRDGRVTKVPFSRFYLNQDTGGAIKGNARVDLYFGYGKSAELAANNVFGLGEQYFLILK